MNQHSSEQKATSKRHRFEALLFPAAPTPDRPTMPALTEAPSNDADESHVRLRPLNAEVRPMLHLAPPAARIEWLDAEEVLDELAEDQLKLTVDLARLETMLFEVPRDPSARAAALVLADRVHEVGALRDALASVAVLADERRFHGLFVPESPLSDYLRGLYAWAHALVHALETLAIGLRALQPDWALLRWRIEEAKNFHFDDLMDGIRDEVVRIRILDVPRADELLFALEHLFATALHLEDHLDQRFG